jgi:Leucine-rich repeat (LRR) protein
MLPRICLSVLMLAGGLSANEERDIALWILRLGGQVMIDGVDQPIADPFDLPARDFKILVVDMHGTITEPKDLEPLKKLKDVRELYVPARVWSPVSDVKAPFSDESFQYYQGMSKLEKFHAGLTTLAWLDIGDEGVKRMAPLTQLKHLRLNNTTIKDPKCFEALVNLESLDLGDAYVLDNSLAPLAAMKNLRRLNLVGTLVTDDGLKHLRGLTRMEDLDLYGVKVTDTGVQYLSQLTRLRRLNLLGAQITDTSASVLAGFIELRELNLYRSQITNAGLAKLYALKNLEALDLRYSGVSGAGVQALRAALPRVKIAFVDAAPGSGSRLRTSAPAGPGEPAIAKWIESLGGHVRMAGSRIQSASLARAPITDAQLKHLATLTAIEKLDLEATEVGDLGIASLAKLTHLHELNLSFTSVSDRGLVHLAGMKNLRRLALSGLRVSDAGFANLSGLAALQDLDLTSTAVTDEALVHISKIAALERLALAYSDVGDEGMGALAKLSNLINLDLRGVDIGDAGVAKVATIASLRELDLNHGRFTEKSLALLSALRISSDWR